MSCPLRSLINISISGTEGYIEKDLDFDYYDFLGFTKEEEFEDTVSISFDFHNQPQEVPDNFHSQDEGKSSNIIVI